MKKVSLILLVLILLCTLVSCNGEPRAKLVDTGVISYNGSLYYVEDHQFSLVYDTYGGVYSDAFRDETKRREIKAVLPILYAYLVWGDDFGDNIIMAGSINTGPVYFFKEGFEFPNYNEVGLDRIKTEFPPFLEIEIPEDKYVTWKDIIDYDTTREIDLDNDYPHCYVMGDIREYSIYLDTGSFCVVVVDNIAYIGIHFYTNGDYHRDYYKITDEYQEAFLELVELSEQ